MDKKELPEIITAYTVLLAVVSHLSIETAKQLAIPLFTAFILHELAHRYAANRFGFEAKFEMWKEGIIFALFLWVITGFRFTFFAPGAVVVGDRKYTYDWYFNPYPTEEEMGKIALAGPATNIAVTVLSLAAYAVHPNKILLYTIVVNLWIALFNLIPVDPLDGKKIYRWNPYIWAALFLPILAVFIVFFLS